jgi:hypothetical protein
LYKGKLAIARIGNLFRGAFGKEALKTIWGFEKVKWGRHSVFNNLCRARWKTLIAVRWPQR